MLINSISNTLKQAVYMCKFDKQHIVEELKNKLGSGWHVYPVNIYQNSTRSFTKSIIYCGSAYCVHCRSNSISVVHTDSYETFLGGATEWVFQCKDCEKFMSIEHEW